MKTWKDSLEFSNLYNRTAKTALVLLFILLPVVSFGQTAQKPDSVRLSPIAHIRRDTIPKPKSVMLKSVFIPGWGQIVNHQIWKVPIIYGGLVGMTMYGVYLTKLYHGYRAAYYNSLANPSTGTHTDQRYGPTPSNLSAQSADALVYYRNYYHNRRDMVFLGVGLVYGLNILDAYVFAELRDFDVSNNLSMSTSIAPVVNNAYQGVALSLTFHIK